MICYLYDAPILFKAPIFFLFSPEASSLLYYSHIPSAVIALLVGFFVFLNAPKVLLNRLLFFITICFSLWVVISLMSWTVVSSQVILFVWPFFAMLAALMFVLCIYFTYVFLRKGQDVSSKIKFVFFLLLLPVLLLAHTNLSVGGFDLAACDAFEYEGNGFKIYYTILGLLAMGWTLFLFIRNYKSASPEFRKQILFMAIGMEFFLLLFATVIPLVTYLAGEGYLMHSNNEWYALFGMVFFMIMMAVLIVRFKTFKAGALAADALVIALLILVASQYTFVDTTMGNILTTVTLVLTAVAGLMIVRNVRKEIGQREEIEKLAGKLKTANERLKVLDKMKSEFVSIASHQLRSPITSIRGYISMLLEGSYGKFPQKARDVLQNISDSSKYMAASIEDYLNVSRIEAGNMKYENIDFSLKDEAEKITDELRQVAIKKGLVLVYRSDCKGTGMIHADIGKTRQVIMNLIDNAIKYTPKGTVSVVVHDNPSKKKICVSIQDTGIGMSNETIDEVFDKFVRAKNANEVNVTGTGLGLFVAKKMIVQMKGKVWAESDGEGSGSVFHIEFPLLKGKGNPHK